MRPAFVTGGSSGIGLAAALQLAAAGHDIALFARDAQKLGAARDEILSRFPNIKVSLHPVDVQDRAAIEAAVAEAIAALDVPEMAIASAGIAVPGLFTEQPLDLHDQTMAINYFGALYFTHAITAAMRSARVQGRISLISSGAAFFGIYGYGAYAPSKFALRGLAEVLRIELAPYGIGVTLCYPPDTDTPQLAAEKLTKPLATRKITEGGGLWSADNVAKVLIKGMRGNKFVVAPGVQMGALNWLTSLIAPVLRWHQQRIVAKHGSERP